MRGTPEVRARIRRALEPEIEGWLRAANDVLERAQDELREMGYAGLALIVDDLDKMVVRPHADGSRNTAEYLFIDREPQLSGLRCHVVYTLPIALAYSAQGQTLANLYGAQPPVVPMIKLHGRPPRRRPFAPGRDKIRQVIARRLGKENVEEDTIFASSTVRDELILLSGGQLRELMILLREALIAREDLPLDERAVQLAAREPRRAYRRQLYQEHRALLKEVAESGELRRTGDNDALVRTLLDSRAVLQYVNDDEWYDVNPLIGFEAGGWDE